MSSDTCSFIDGGTSVAVFCDKGCCDNECCKDDVEFPALYVVLAVIIGFILLLVLIALIVYCCVRRKKRRKGDWRDSLLGNRNDVVPLSILHTEKDARDRSSSNSGSSSPSSGSSGALNNTFPYGRVDKFVQTGNANPEVKDKILGGRSKRWSSYNPHKKPMPSRSHLHKPSDRSSQTIHPDTPGIISTDYAEPHHRDYLEPYHSHPAEKAVQTPTPRSTTLHGPSHRAKDRNQQFTPVYGDKKKPPKKRMWLPAPQHNSLAPRIPSGPQGPPPPEQDHKH